MKKLYLLILLMTSITWMSSAKQVEENMARTVAGNFFANHIDRNQFPTVPASTMVYSAGFKQAGQAEKPNTLAAFYVFNFSTPHGFVIVSGNDAVSPILAYSTESSFETEHIPANLSWWLKGYELQMAEVTEQDFNATPEIKAEWEVLLSDAGTSSASLKTAKADSFLVKLKWDQSPYYNDKCPYDSVKKLRTQTGCVATAMAMIMKYHNNPVKGTGEHSYKHKTYGILTADFKNTTYQWNNMPDSLLGPNDAVAILMYHCGVSFDINYGTRETSGRALARNHDPNDTCSENALKKYFGYDPNLRGVDSADYSPADWIKMLKDEIDALRPVMYGGQDTSKTNPGGHSFLCDGYNNNNQFHFNWGWGGKFNGYYKIDDKEYYPRAQEAIIGIRKNSQGIGDQNLPDNEETISAYPNPFSSETTLKPGKILKDACLTVYNAWGQPIKQINNISGQTVTFYRDNLPCGIYFLRLTQDNQSFSGKLIIRDK